MELRTETIRDCSPVDVVFFNIFCPAMSFIYYYRPQRSWGKVMISKACVILFTGGGVCLSACWDTTPPRTDTPQSRPPGVDTPWEQTPPSRACWEIRSTHGWYASYWNAILFLIEEKLIYATVFGIYILSMYWYIVWSSHEKSLYCGCYEEYRILITRIPMIYTAAL